MKKKEIIGKIFYKDGKVILGRIISAYGIKGYVKVKSYTEKPDGFLLYRHLNIANNKNFCLERVNSSNKFIVCSSPMITSREQALKFVGEYIWTKEENLPELIKTNEFYQRELLGIKVLSASKFELGKVKAIHNFGAGDLIELDSSYSHMIRFDKKTIKEVNLKKRFILVNIENIDY